MDAQSLRGVYPAIVTPFTADDRLDEIALARVTDYVIEGGVHAIMSTGGTGEFPHLDRQERKRATEVIVTQARGRVPIIAGTAAASTREAIHLSQDAQEAGASAVILTPPYYFQLPASSLIEHFRLVSDELSIPVVVYNNPLYTGNNLSPQTIAELSGHTRIIGCKQSNADMGQLVEVLRLAPSTFSVNTGIDSQFYPALCTGARGIFSTAASVIPRQMVEIYRLTMSGEHEAARALHMKVQVLNRFLEYDPGYVAPCKEALEMLGIRVGPPRKPMPGLTAEERAGVRAALKDLGLLQ
jgi:4-hydroxy-tetrahydrodipicolinate synthase